jgi:hypothetical protein
VGEEEAVSTDDYAPVAAYLAELSAEAKRRGEPWFRFISREGRTTKIVANLDGSIVLLDAPHAVFKDVEPQLNPMFSTERSTGKEER